MEERAAALATRSIKRDAKLWALDLAIRCTDLTTLEGTDTVGKIVAMCSKAIRPDPLDPAVPSVAAVCIYPWLVPTAVTQLAGSTVRVASVAGGFPAGLGPSGSAARHPRVVAWADEVDITVPTGRSSGRPLPAAFEELVAARESRRRVSGDPEPASSVRTIASAKRARSRWRPVPTSSRRRPARSGEATLRQRCAVRGGA